jgi:integrase
MLKEYRTRQLEQRFKLGGRWEDSDRIFTQSDGKPVHPDSVTQTFKKFISKTNLPQISIHSLRHTNITLQIAAGIPLKTVSWRAGHASTNGTNLVYSHMIRSSEEKAAQVLEDILNPVGNMHERSIGYQAR